MVAVWHNEPPTWHVSKIPISTKTSDFDVPPYVLFQYRKSDISMYDDDQGGFIPQINLMTSQCILLIYLLRLESSGIINCRISQPQEV